MNAINHLQAEVAASIRLLRQLVITINGLRADGASLDLKAQVVALQQQVKDAVQARNDAQAYSEAAATLHALDVAALADAHDAQVAEDAAVEQAAADLNAADAEAASALPPPTDVPTGQPSDQVVDQVADTSA